MPGIWSGGPLVVPEESIPAQFYRSVERQPTRGCFMVRSRDDGPFETVSYADVARRVADVGNALLARGVRAGDKFAILSDTRPEWVIADLAILSAGATTVTVYPTLTADQIAYLLNDSGAVGVFVSDAAQLAKIAAIASKVKSLQHVIAFETAAAPAGLATTLADFEASGRAHAPRAPGALDARWRAVRPTDLCTIVYTSGTTGVPKGALLTHRNFVAAAGMIDDRLGLSKGGVMAGGATMAFLPLAHCYQRLVVFTVLALGHTVAFTTPSRLGADLAAVQPRLLASVPRLYERMYDQIQAKVPKEKRRIFDAAESIAKAYGAATNAGRRPSLVLRVKHAVFDRLVYAGIREKIGARNLELVITGSAAIRPDLLYFFRGVGVPILEAYGLTETSAPSHVNAPSKFKVGTVGPVLAGMEMRLDADGEVLLRGPNVFMGYHNQPGETADAFTADGWFRTGDLGAVDADGYLRIIDRKKEIEVLSTGKKISPIVVEEGLKASPFIGEALLTATDRKFAGVLVYPRFERLLAWARERGIPFDESSVEKARDPTGAWIVHAVGADLAGHPDVRALYRNEIDRLNANFADYERVKVFRVMRRALTNPMLALPLPPGQDYELTPKLSKKRRVIVQNNRAEIEAMFTS